MGVNRRVGFYLSVHLLHLIETQNDARLISLVTVICNNKPEIFVSLLVLFGVQWKIETRRGRLDRQHV